ncbi:Brefeldin A-inhibited guanine nucleotide-exchange protein 1 [Perkinsus chesapeaki]|uniref:Brefeldin A-inhibited guanine nucleotide-exchange protein 1 n=1 Tax=Perkinsus chesapeaki TaxID=330153 RepID=A0A7J6LKA0_PERCH|nr:Brefeldin A-inhibited guanine nucleotide-exchange protein 1 [Perkinsus chesapeaki]
MANIIERISSWTGGGSDDEHTLTTLRELLSAVTAPNSAVHGEDLIKGVKLCFEVHRSPKSSELAQRTAQAVLTQILHATVQRAEMSPGDIIAEAQKAKAASVDESTTREPSPSASPSSKEDNMSEGGRERQAEEWIDSQVGQWLDEAVAKVDPSAPNERGEAPKKFGFCIVCRKPAPHYCIDTKDPVCSKACKEINLQRRKVVDHCPPIESEEEGAPTLSNGERSPINDGVDVDARIAVYLDDALKIFSTLCTISLYGTLEPPAEGAQVDPSSTTDPLAVKTKRLSLDMVLCVINGSGDNLKTNPAFIEEIKTRLMYSILRNCVSPVPKIFTLALQVFVAVATNPDLKAHISTQIGVFVEEVFKRILDSGNSSYQHKHRVLQVFYKLCTDATTSLDLFMEYDCSVSERNVFEGSISTLAKIAQGGIQKSGGGDLQPEQESKLRTLALESLVTLTGSMVELSNRPIEPAGGREKSSEEQGSEEKGNDVTTGSCSGGDSESGGGTPKNAISSAVNGTAKSSAIVAKARKSELEAGVRKFNMKPKRGVEYFVAHGFCNSDPQDVARLLKRTRGLSKTAFGDYLGEDEPFNLQVMYSLVESHDFRGMDLVSALREFLEDFRLPGESQKIDRMMEKFAEHYCKQNPEAYANADCAYILSFSLIMLNTDLHSSQVKNKMSLDDFKRNNRGINDGADIPDAHLDFLYNEIKNKPFSLDEDEDLRLKLASQQKSAMQPSRRFELFIKETESIVEKSKEMLSKKPEDLRAVQDPQEYLGPMFEVMWGSILGTLSQLMNSEDESIETIEWCVEGLKHAVRLCAKFDMETERECFVAMLAKYTGLMRSPFDAPVSTKNIMCIKALLSLANNETDGGEVVLGHSWKHILLMASQIDRLTLSANRAKSDYVYFTNPNGSEPQRHTRSSMMGSMFATHSSSTSAPHLARQWVGTGVSVMMKQPEEPSEAEINASKDLVEGHPEIVPATDAIFQRSINLSNGEIIVFVEELCSLSSAELAVVDNPRVFCLQKLVEVADINMSNRIRLVWSRIWRVLSAHFAQVAQSKNQQLSMYAIDSLRQLALKFLQKDELSNYHFQVEFLRPFEAVMASSESSREVKELILSIMESFVASDVTRSNMKSGWKSVFHVLSLAATSGGDKVVVEMGMRIVTRLREDYFDTVCVENMRDYVRVLVGFAQCTAGGLEVSMKAMQYLQDCIDYLADPDNQLPPIQSSYQQTLIPGSTPQSGSTLPTTASPGRREVALATSAQQQQPALHWFPILHGLEVLVFDSRRDVRTSAIDKLFDCLTSQIDDFDNDTLLMIFNGVLSPLFDDLLHLLTPGNRPPAPPAERGATEQGVTSSTCLSAVSALTRLVDRRFDRLGFLLPQVLTLLGACIHHESEAVARIGVEAEKQLLTAIGSRCSDAQWIKIAEHIYKLFKTTLPNELTNATSRPTHDGHQNAVKSRTSALPFDSSEVVTKCLVQLLLIDLVYTVVFKEHYDRVPPEAVQTILDALQLSFKFAHSFNVRLDVREKLKKLGFMRDMRQLPGLLKQEREGICVYFRLLIKLYTTTSSRECAAKLSEVSMEVVTSLQKKERFLKTPEGGGLSTPKAADPVKVMEFEREVAGLIPLVSDVILGSLMELPDDMFADNCGDWIFPMLSDLVLVDDRGIRSKVQQIMSTKVRPILNRATPPASPSETSTGVPASSTKYDPQRYKGRFKQLVTMLDPRLLFKTDKDVEDAKALLERFRNGEQTGATDKELWAARKLYEAAIHPVTQEVIPPYGRMASFVPVNVPIVLGMLTMNSTPAIVFWQWVNQSYNAVFNYCNRSGVEMDSREQAISYALATGSSCAMALLLKRFQPESLKKVPWVLPYISVATGGTANLYFTRRPELQNGTPLLDPFTNEQLGVSRKAGEIAFMKTWISRTLVLPMPLLILPSTLKKQAFKTFIVEAMWFGDLRRHRRGAVSLEALLIILSLSFALPACVALYPQKMEVAVTSLEPEFLPLRNRHGGRMTHVVVNKGL